MSTRNGETDVTDQRPGGDRRKPAFLRPALIVFLFALLVFAAWLVLCPKFGSPRGTAKIVQAQTDVAVLITALGNFHEDTSHYPTSAEGLAALSVAPNRIPNWKGPYIARPVLNDPWGHPYVYVCPGKHNQDGYDLHSFGASGKDGAEDNIDNWTAR
jgi:general secretion pathway protein G